MTKERFHAPTSKKYIADQGYDQDDRTNFYTREQAVEMNDKFSEAMYKSKEWKARLNGDRQ